MKAITGDINLSLRLNKSNLIGFVGKPQPFFTDSFGTIPFVMYSLHVVQIYSRLLIDI